jgi:glycerate kinase
MRVLLAPDKFKGSATAAEVCAHLAAGLRSVAPDLEVVTAPIADGGDGTLDALLGAGYERRTATVADSLGRPCQAAYGVRGDEAVLELAQADSLRRLSPEERAPRRATSRGLGELIRQALDDGCRRLTVTIGGSANTDGGSGMLVALGARLLAADGADLGPGGGELARLHHLDLTGLDSRLAETDVVVACDVDNPLLGVSGTASVYAPQKGATPDDVAVLEAGMRRWAEVAAATTGVAAADAPGAGAAGGVGFALITFLRARIRPGIDVVMDAVGFHEHLAAASVVVTGEGSLDEQTLHGKGPAGVAQAARRAGVPCVAVAGRSTLTGEQAAAAGFARVHTLVELAADAEHAMRDATALLEQVGSQLATELADVTAGPPAGSPAPTPHTRRTT